MQNLTVHVEVEVFLKTPSEIVFMTFEKYISFLVSKIDLDKKRYFFIVID